MKTWKFENGVTVKESPFDKDLHSFDVYHNGKYLGGIFPACVEDMKSCIASLDKGENPILSHWEDGCGNSCTLDGWGVMK